MPREVPTMPSREYLDKLFEAENEAKSLLEDARAEASRRIAAVRSDVDARFAEARSAKAAAADADAQKKRSEADAGCSAEIEAYRASLDDVPTFYDKLAAWCEESLDGII